MSVRAVDTPLQQSTESLDLDTIPQTQLVPETLYQIQLLMDRLDLGVSTQCTAYYFLHAYDRYISTSPLGLDWHMVVPVIVSLACRSTESHRKIRDILNVYYTIIINVDGGGYMRIGEDYWSIKESTSTVEFIILRILGFRLQVDLPHPWILRITRVMMDQTPMSSAVSQLAIAMANDVYRCGGGIEGVGVRVVAAACVWIAVRMLRMQMSLEFGKFVRIWSGGRSDDESLQNGLEAVAEILAVLSRNEKSK
jgi:hypothetical protein